MARESDAPHFFKVILKDDDDFRLGNLRIPKKFVRAHERDFSDTVILEVPGGDTWDVKLFKVDGEFLLKDGWADFTRHYGVKHGHFVIFRYEGGSKFHVAICDVTACEIDYPPKPTAQPYPAPHIEVTRDRDTSVQELKIGGAKPRLPVETRKSPQSRCSRPAKMAPSSGIHRGTFGGHTVNNCSRKDSPALEAAQKSGALSRACSIQCERPSALIVIQPTYVYPKYCFYAPNEFVTTFIPKVKKSCVLRLSIPGGRSWTVGYSTDGRCSRIQRRWKMFAVDNDLRVGDVCVFESLGGAKLAFRVLIFRSHPEGVARPCPSSHSKRRRDFDGAGSSESGHRSVRSRRDSSKCKKHPFFRVAIQPSALIHSINVPASFTKEHMEPKVGQAKRVDIHATLKVNGKSWPVTVTRTALDCNRYRIVKGWLQFAKEHDLRRGDVCLFTKVDMDWVFRVSVTRKGRD